MYMCNPEQCPLGAASRLNDEIIMIEASTHALVANESLHRLYTDVQEFPEEDFTERQSVLALDQANAIQVAQSVSGEVMRHEDETAACEGVYAERAHKLFGIKFGETVLLACGNAERRRRMKDIRP